MFAARIGLAIAPTVAKLQRLNSIFPPQTRSRVIGLAVQRQGEIVSRLLIVNFIDWRIGAARRKHQCWQGIILRRFDF
jgi:hypothetical protein